MTHNTSIPNQIFSILCFFWLKLVWNFIQRIPPWDIWLVTFQFKIIISWVCAYFWLKLVWSFTQMIPPCEIRLVTLQLKITISWIFDNFCWNWVSNFIQKIPPWKSMTHNTSIPNQIFSILCLFFAEIGMKFQWKKTLLWNDT